LRGAKKSRGELMRRDNPRREEGKRGSDRERRVWWGRRESIGERMALNATINEREGGGNWDQM
jgi:hypothetical protein